MMTTLMMTMSNEPYLSRSSQIAIFECKDLEEMLARVNAFCKGKFVVGIQYPESLKDKLLVAVVSYKVQNE